jgi:hypothetical protein
MEDLANRGKRGPWASYEAPLRTMSLYPGLSIKEKDSLTAMEQGL